MPKLIKQGNGIKLEATEIEVRKYYLEKIKESELLGEPNEVTRLQGEWNQKKKKFI